MSMTISKPKIQIDEEVLTFLTTEEKRAAIVHCRISSPFPTLARIWNTTYLLEEKGNRCSLIKAFNIAMAPQWTRLDSKNGFLSFTLLFEGLSKGCSSFQLVEEIKEPGGFFSNKIKRNSTDVYKAVLFY